MATQDQTQNPTAQSTLNFNSVMIGTEQPQALVVFYEKLFRRPADWQDGGYAGWKVGDGFLTIGEHSEIHGQAKEPARILLNFESSDVQGEFARLKGLGVRVIKEPYTMDGEEGWISTLADPDGNYVQLNTPFGM
jgi:predicted enzyme related to lactoylglutathione lyase